MDKLILTWYSDALVRIKLLRQQVTKKQIEMERLKQKGIMVSDSVSCGKRGKKPLATVKISGFPLPEYEKKQRELERQITHLLWEEEKLLALITQVEEFISEIPDIEIRNIMTLYYIEDLNWVQVAFRMNQGYKNKKKHYTADSCRCKHDRYLDKN